MVVKKDAMKNELAAVSLAAMKNELAAVKLVATVAATSEKMAEMVVGLKLADVNEKLQAYETFLWFVDDCSYERQFEKE